MVELGLVGKMLPYNQDRYDAGQGAVQHSINADVNLDDAIKHSQDFLLSQQYPEGYWWADLESNATITADTVLLFKILGIESTYPLHKMENYIRRLQCSHGAWELYYGDGGNLSVTIESYIALRLLKVPRSDPALLNAHKFIISNGGITQSRIFTKLCLAMLGCFDWNGLPSLPPWLMLLPSWFLSSIYEMSSWARGCTVPLIVVFDKKPVFKVTPEVSFDELYAEGKKYARTTAPLRGDFTDIYIVVDRLLKATEQWGVVPFRQRGIKAAEKWVLERQEDTGDWAGIFPAMFYSMICLKTLGEVTDPVLHRGLLALKDFSVETADEYSVQPCVSPVWDTALVVRSLVESGIAPDHPALQKAGEWLLKKQITQHGDWSFKNKSGCAGGWAFEFVNRWYPDVDDSAVVVMALDGLRLPNEDVKNGAIARSIKWICSMQCKAGGWAAFDKDNDQDWLNLTPYGDLKAMIDPNTVDVTARVLEMVGRLKLRQDLDGMVEAVLPPVACISKGLSYVRKEQEKEGCWFGRWGVNYIYGTCGVLVALSLVAATTHREEIERGARWLVEVQNMEDKRKEGYGGWGETCDSYNDSGLKGKLGGASTPSQTAWALMGLLAAGDALGKYEVDSIEHGVRYLLSLQRTDGSWHEPHFTGTGFPQNFYLRYHY